MVPNYDHDHDHDHAHHPANGSSSLRRLTIALLLTAGYLVAEIVGGLLTNSLALLADAGHMLTDVASLALAVFAVWLAARPAPPEKTFGYYRAEILAALVNGAALLAACAWIIFEAVRRLREPTEVLGPGMFAVACGGLVVNLIAVKVLHGSHEHNLNVRGAWLHVIADTLGSVAAIAGAVLVWWMDWHWADPAASLAIALLVLFSAWRLTAQATSVLMESVPEGLDIEAIRTAIASTPGVTDQHDLHVWSITTGRVCLSVHVTSEPNLPRGEMLRRLRPMLQEKFGIAHATIQVEPQDYEDCGSNCNEHREGEAPAEPHTS